MKMIDDDGGSKVWEVMIFEIIKYWILENEKEVNFDEAG